MKQRIILLYDGECPICHQYSHYVRLRQKYDVQLHNAREHPQLVSELREKGYDINQGMIVMVGEAIYHKHQALLILHMLTERKGRLDAIVGKIIQVPGVMKMIYPFLFAFRWLLLKRMGKDSKL